MKGTLNLLRKFSIPLVVGVSFALTRANIDPEQYHTFLNHPFFTAFSLHFLTNELFMTLLFSLAAAEIAVSALPGGGVHPLKPALNPLLATLGVVLGPVAVFVRWTPC